MIEEAWASLHITTTPPPPPPPNLFWFVKFGNLIALDNVLSPVLFPQHG